MNLITSHTTRCLFITLLLYLTGCCRQEERSVPQLAPAGPDALLYRIEVTNTIRPVETNGVVFGEGPFKDEDWEAILALLHKVPIITLKVQRVNFFGSPRPVAAEVQLPSYTVYFVKPVFEGWKGGAVVFDNRAPR